MTKQPTELKDSIRLAIEAAGAANDAAAQVDELKDETVAATDQLRGFGARMRPLILGALIGAVLSFVLGGLIYFRTLSDMRTASATQIEALTLFTERIGTLDAQLAGIAALNDNFAALQSEQAAGFEALGAQLTALEGALSENAEALGETGRNTQSQFSRGILDAVAAAHEETRAAMLANASDLQLALTRILADGVVAAPSAPASAPKPAPKARPAPRPKPRPAPAPNPFSYP